MLNTVTLPFLHSLISFLGPSDYVEAAIEYIGVAPERMKRIMSIKNPKESLEMQLRVRERHEKVNRGIKQ